MYRLTPARWNQVVEIAERSLQRPSSTRIEFATRLCDGDSELETAVRKHLASMTSCPQAFLETQVRDSCNGADVTSAPLPVLPGYTVLDCLGRGAQSTIYRATEDALKREVALKVSHRISADPQHKSRFSREATVAGRLQHPHIVPVFGFGTTESVFWIAMEYVRGHDLHTELDKSQDTKRFLPGRSEAGFVRNFVQIISNLADALQHAHDNNVIHRDVKPQNILLRPDGRAQLTDFGISRDLSEQSRTETIGLQGTPYYMCPELIDPELGSVGSASDQYSLAVVLYEGLAGKVPFQGSSIADVLNAIGTKPTPALRAANKNLPLDLDTICSRAMQRNPAARYSSTGEFGKDLQRFLGLEAIVATRPQAWSRIHSWSQRNGKRAVLIAVAMLVVISGTVFSITALAKSERSVLLDLELNSMEKVVSAAEEGHGNRTSLEAAAPRLQLILERSTAIDGPLRARVRDLETRVNDLSDELSKAGRAMLLAAQGKPAEGSYQTLSLTNSKFFHALTELEHAARLRPSDGGLTRDARLEEYLPTLSVTSEPSGAMVSLRPIKWTTGEYGEVVDLGRTPLDSCPIIPGQYRVVITHGGIRTAELSRWFGEWMKPYDLGKVVLHRTSEVVVGMASFASGTHKILLPEYKRLRTDHEAFYLDRTEVSNAEYLRFFEATNSSHEPLGLKERESLHWQARPVVGIPWAAALAYAEWCGKRLPTALEWNRAAIGSYDPKKVPGSDRAIVRSFSGRLGDCSDDQAIQLYLTHSKPAASNLGDITGEGVLHMAGNVSEWTDTVTLNLVGTLRVPMITHRQVKGSNWAFRITPSVITYQEMPIAHRIWEPTIGFRCAKSRLP